MARWGLLALVALTCDAFAVQWSASSHSVLKGDYDGDGRQDFYLQAKARPITLAMLGMPPLVVPQHQHDVLLLQEGAGAYRVVTPIDRVQLQAVAWQSTAMQMLPGDFNGDGRPDLLLRPEAHGEDGLLLSLDASARPSVAQVLNSRELGIELSGDAGYELVWRDVDRDGKADLVLSKPGVEPEVLLGSALGLRIAAPYAEVGIPADGTPARASAWGVAEGNSQVTLDGRLAYSLPVTLPAGINDMQPALSFTYQMSAADSFLGEGWGLSGLMSLHRCGATIAQDGYSGLPSGSALDKLCLDGQRLQLVSGGEWQPGSVYRTEIESFSKITLLGSASEPYFEVRARNGWRFTLGRTPASRMTPVGGKTLAWQLDTAEDSLGNQYTVGYSSHGGQLLPASIDYATGRIRLEYRDREFPLTQYALGGEMANRSLLDRVVVEADSGTRLREYRLGYQHSANTRKPRISFIQHCAQNQCLDPVRFDYQSQPAELIDAGLQPATKSMFSNFLSVESPMDWNGDGINDLLTVTFDRITVALGSENGLGDATKVVSPATGFAFLTGTPIDVDGDGTQEILYLTVKSGSPNLLAWHYLKSDGVSRKVVEWQASDLQSVITNINGSQPPGQTILATAARAVALDFNHDGRLDLLLPAKGRWQIYDNRADAASGFVESNRFSNVAVSAAGAPWFEPYALEGDGRWQLLTTVTSSQQTYALLPVPRQGSITAAQKVNIGIAVERSVIFDANGDGLPDFAIPNASNQIQLYLNKGGAPAVTGFKLVNTGLSSVGIFAPAGLRRDLENYLPKPVDYDGDGLQDLLYLDNASQRYDVLRSTGEGFQRITTGVPMQLAQETFNASAPGCERHLTYRANTLAQIRQSNNADMKTLLYALLAMVDLRCEYLAAGPLTAPHHSLIGDWTGDGRADLLLAAQDNDRIVWRLYRQAHSQGEWLKEITDSLGRQSRIEYASIQDPAVYQGEPGGQFPILNWRGPRYMVAGLQQSNGVGGFNETRYQYRDAKVHLLGRGFLGFAQVISEDVTRQRQLTRHLHQAFPLLGISHEEELKQGAALLSRTSQQWTSSSSFAGKVHFPYMESSLQESFESGQPVSATRRSLTMDSQFGNLLDERTEEAGTASGPALRTTQVTRQYSNNESAWLLGFVTEENTRISADGQTISRRHGYRAQSGSLLVAEENLYLNEPALQQNILYQRDARGRLTQLSRSGPSFTARSEQYGDYQGPWPGFKRNALGHEQRFAYEAGSGLVTRQEDANGLVSQAQYDPFGRQRLNVEVDGSQVQRSYQNCAAALACPAQARWAIRERTLSAAGNQQGAPERWQFMDELEREVRRRHQGFSGAWVNVDSQYDALGRVVRQSEPYSQAPLYLETSWDDQDRPVQRQLPGGATLSFSYGASGAGGSWRQYSLSYQLNGLQTRTERRENDALGQLIRSINALGSPLETTLDYAYSPLGNLRMTRVNGDPRTDVLMQYDSAGQRISLQDPNSGQQQMRYDALGHLLEATASDGSRIVSHYDLLGRLVERNDIDAAGTPQEGSRWTYDSAPNGVGKLAGMGRTDQSFLQVYGYDGLSRPSLRQTTIAQGGQSFNYNDGQQYDSFSRPAITQDATGFRYISHYNGYGYLSGESQQDTGSPLRLITEQNDRGQNTRVRYGNGVETHHEYDAATGWLERITSGSPQGVLQQLSYHYGQNGLLLSREDARGFSESFDYDLLQRLTSSTRSLAGQALQDNYRYDALGNLLQNPAFTELDYGAYDAAGQAACAAVNAASPGPHAVTRSNAGYYCYDARGNQLSGPGREVRYSLYDKPLRISSNGRHSDFSYDPERRRYLQVADNRITVYLDEGRFEEVLDNGQRWQNSYIGGYLQVQRPPGSDQLRLNYQLQDQLGSLESVADTSGALLEKRSYAPFGGLRGADWSDTPAPLLTTRRGFTDHEHLSESGLIHMNGRVYDPSLGRFLSADIVYQDTANAQMFNRYSYGFNSPFAGVDPTGYACIGLCDWTIPFTNIPLGYELNNLSYTSPIQPFNNYLNGLFNNQSQGARAYFGSDSLGQLKYGERFESLSSSYSWGVFTRTSFKQNLDSYLDGYRPQAIAQSFAEEGAWAISGLLVKKSPVGHTVAEVFERVEKVAEQGRDALGRFLPKSGGEIVPGSAAEQAVWDAVKQKPGWSVIEGRVSVRNADGQLRIYDGAAVSPRGRIIGLEVKSGSATKTASQRNFDSGVSTYNPAVGVGNSSGVSVGRSLEIRVP
jgi:RHS repeat-associated protein